MCKTMKIGNTRGIGKFGGGVGLRRINLIQRCDNQSDESSERDVEQHDVSCRQWRKSVVYIERENPLSTILAND